MSQHSEPLVCPGLFYATPAQDGVIYRIRTPAGMLTSAQAHVVAEFAEQLQGEYVQVTNRANLQVRSLHPVAPRAMLCAFQEVGLAASLSGVDHLRNIMASPTAGIDAQALVDTRPFVAALDATIVQHEEFAGLPAKFSVGFDGGEALSVRHHPNDIWLIATAEAPAPVERPGHTFFHLLFNVGQGQELDTGLRVGSDACVPLVVAVVQVYLAEVKGNQAYAPGKKPRLRQVIAQRGITWYLEELRQRLPGMLPDRPVALIRCADVAPHSRHTGAHLQRQPGFSYLGVIAPLGRLTVRQFQALADLAEAHGSGTLRLTPWQNVLVPDIPHARMPALRLAVADLGLYDSATHPWSALVACTGNRGCQASASDTTGHALQVANHLAKEGHLDRPMNIHLSGCTKSCAQHHQSDIALLGVTVPQGGTSVEGYRVHVGGEERPFGRVLCDAVPAEDLPALMARLLHLYRQRRHSVDESFAAFADRTPLLSLQEVFTPPLGDGTPADD